MKNVLITGTSRGIGIELVKNFSEKGFRVIAISRTIQPIEELNLKNVHAIAADITNQADLLNLKKYLTEEKLSIDILIHNAGKLVHKNFEETTLQDFKDIYNVNVFAVANLTQLVLPYFSKNAHIVTISSMGGVQGSVKFSGLSAYSSSKGALITLTEMLAEEYKEKSLFFNVLALGAVQTEMLEEAFPGYQAPTKAAEMSNYIVHFATTGHQFYNGKILQVSNSTP